MRLFSEFYPILFLTSAVVSFVLFFCRFISVNFLDFNDRFKFKYIINVIFLNFINRFCDVT